MAFHPIDRNTGYPLSLLIYGYATGWGSSRVKVRGIAEVANGDIVRYEDTYGRTLATH